MVFQGCLASRDPALLRRRRRPFGVAVRFLSQNGYYSCVYRRAIDVAAGPAAENVGERLKFWSLVELSGYLRELFRSCNSLLKWVKNLN